jgi:outer membrane protein assembly factor BamA
MGWSRGAKLDGAEWRREDAPFAKRPPPRTMNLRFFSAAFLAATILFGAPAQAEEKLPPVKSVEFQVVGPISVSLKKILQDLQIEPGKPCSTKKYEEAVHKLKEAEDVKDVRIFGEPVGDGVKVTVVVQTKKPER